MVNNPHVQGHGLVMHIGGAGSAGKAPVALIPLDTLQEGKEIDGVVAHNDEMALGAYDAIADAGKAGEIKVIGIDAIDAAKKSVAAGELDATVLQDVESIGKKTVEVAIEMCKGEKVDDVYNVDPVLLTKDNIADYVTE